MQRTIIVIDPGALGDLLLSLPAIRAIRNAFPACDVGLIAQGEVSRMLSACGEIQAVFPIETQALTSLLSEGEAEEARLQFWLQRCDLAVAWMADPQGRLRATLHKAGVREAIIRSPISSSFLAVHQEDRFLETINGVVPGVLDGGKLALPPAVIDSAKAKLETFGIIDRHRPLVILHPGTGSPHKCGDPALFAELIAHCESRDTIPVIIGGPADDEMTARVIDRCKRKPAMIQHEALLSIAGILAHAAVFVGYDSGLSHLAARLYIPTIAVFGPTDPRRWAPRGPNVTVLTGEMCRCEGWEAVRSCHEKPCLRISVQRFIAACEQALQRQAIPVHPVPDCLVMSKDLC